MSEPNLESLKELYPESVDVFWRTVTKPVIRVMEGVARRKIGPREIRVGVFGPYPKGGKQTIIRIAKIVSELKFAAVTGDGFFLPGDPKVFHGINELMPLYLHKVRKPIPSHVFFHEFPRLVSKAIFFENDERGQFVELQGCSDYGIPALGFIRHKRISASRCCNFLIYKDTYTKCAVPDKELCLHPARPRLFCPFYDSINIPWFSKELFITKKNWLVAVRRTIALKRILNEFL